MNANNNSTTALVARQELLNAECDGLTYGVTFLPWDDRFQLEPPPERMRGSPQIKGAIAISNQLVPIFDLSDGTRANAESNTYLLVVSMCNPTSTAPMVAGLVVRTMNERFCIPQDAILNLARSN